ncbi:MAG: hypothetical protein PHN31_01820 [Candidatus Gracilibacteria bacterium]|nr:hypothetical protein [Candidatus Gracilibacteria bacterium]
MLKQKFLDDYEYLIKRIFTDKIPTAFSRYNEGEYSLITGKYFCGAGGFWKTYDHKQLLQKDLIETLNVIDDGFIFGIASRQHLRANLFYKRCIKSPYKTFATLFVNNNYKLFKKELESIKEKVVLVANSIGEGNDYPFKVKKYIPIPFDVVGYYQDNKEEILELCQQIANNKNKLVLFCAGPLSNIMIYECWKFNKNNRYIDIGSTLDEYIMKRPTRNYFKEGNKTCNQIDYL